MPITYYSEVEVDNLKAQLKVAHQKIKTLEALRPHWAQGYTSDSSAAQGQTAALSQVWAALKVNNQTICMQRLNVLVSFYNGRGHHFSDIK